MTVTTFSELELDESLLEALQDKGFTRPTAIQAAAIPPALDGRDVLGSAPTGTGKTAAYLLPALQHLLDFPRKKSGPPRILILTPTREAGDAGGRSCPRTGETYASGYRHHHRRRSLYEPRGSVQRKSGHRGRHDRTSAAIHKRRTSIAARLKR